MVPCSHESFIEKAFHVGHPSGFVFLLDPAIHDAIDANFFTDPCHLAKLRVDFVKKWSERARDSQVQENQLHSNMPRDLARVLSGGRLLLLGDMIKAAGCPDKSLVDDIKNGFRISGWMPLSGNTQQRVKRRAMSLDTRLVLCKRLNKGTFERLSHRQDQELEQVAWTETQKEVDAGWAWTANDHQCEGLSVALRFALRQGPSRIRLVVLHHAFQYFCAAYGLRC